MGATLRTPSNLKGFDVDLGNIETTFLVAPMLMFVTFLGRHLFLRFKERKLGFVKDFFGLFKTAREDRSNGFGKGRTVWFIMAFTFTVGFLLMNPFSLFLASFYAFLIYEQGKKNGFIQYIMFYRCAAMRKQVEAGKADEPDYRSINMFFYLFGYGMFLYGLISVLLWFIADYSFWIRAVVTLLMVLFAMIQACMPGLLTGKRAKALAGIALFFAAAVVVSRVLPGGIVLADDGGWSESGGTLLGLIQNAGFSIILGVTAMTLVYALAGPVGWLMAGGAILGGANFVIGLTDTKAGDYVRKSARQFFNEPAPGEDYTLLCTATKIGSFIAGFVNPAAGAGAGTVKALHIGKVTSDLISLTDSTVDYINSVQDYVNGECELGQVIWDAVSFGLDLYSTGNDISEAVDDWADIAKQGDAYKYTPENFDDKIDDIQKDRNRELQRSEYDYDQQYKDLANHDAEINNYQQEISGLDREIRDVEAGKIEPPSGMSKEEYLESLRKYKDEAIEGIENRADEIRKGVDRDAGEAAEEINERFDQVIRNEKMDEGIDQTMDTGGKINSGAKLIDDYVNDIKNDTPASDNGDGQTAGETGKGSSEKPANKPAETPTDTPAEKAEEKTTEKPAKEPSKETEKPSENKSESAGPKTSPQEVANDSPGEPVNVPEQTPGKGTPEHSPQVSEKGTPEHSPQMPEKGTPEHSPQVPAKESERESGKRTVTTVDEIPAEQVPTEADELEEIGEDGKKKKKKDKK